MLGVEVEAFLGLLEQGVGIEVLGDGLAAVESQWNGQFAIRLVLSRGFRVRCDSAGPRVSDLVPWARTDCDEIRRQRNVHREVEGIGLIAVDIGGGAGLGHRVGNNLPTLRCHDVD